MKKFFNSLEEKFVFPVGRRTWQVLVLLSVVVCAGSIIYFLVNSTPTSREDVHVSKDEVVSNKIDTTTVSAPVSECTAAQYQATLDTLKSLLPMAEWKNLGDSTEPYQTYDYVNGEYQQITKRDYRRNDTAMPNVLSDVYSSRGIYDTAAYCAKIEVISILNTLLSVTSLDYRWGRPISSYVRLVRSTSTNLDAVTRGLALRKLIESNSSNITNDLGLDRLLGYLEFTRNHEYSAAKSDALKSLLAAHRGLSGAKYGQSEYFNLKENILLSRLDDEGVTAAVEDFVKDIGFYDANDLSTSLGRYMDLYASKIDRAEADARERASKKEEKRAEMRMAFLYGFAAMLLIAIILLLFSIQSLLKKHTNNE